MVIFNTIRHLPYATWLDSGKPKSTSGRYDIITALPIQRWVSNHQTTDIAEYHIACEPSGITHHQQHTTQSNEDPISLLNNVVKRLSASSLSADENREHDLPFTGGIVAYFSYNLGREKLGVKQITSNDCTLPDMVAGLYTWAIVQDHEMKQCYLAALPECDSTLLEYIQQHLLSQERPASIPFRINALRSNTSNTDYHHKIDKISHYIHSGDCYQVNLSQCFSAEYQGDPYLAYTQLREKMASPFSAFMDIGQQAIMSLSPERFIQTNNQHILTQPIKGTIARNQDASIDKDNAKNLQASEKNRAENLMIVDLLRNDLGKNCIPGSIKVPALFELESYPNVHHLVSTITGTIANNKTALDVFEGCFPGGSITGAPKKRAMEIIEELEDCQRSIYCGSIAYINANGDMDSNITIRTIACDGEKLYCWGGGGIVADSEANDEYQESLTKINALLEVLNQFKQ